MCTRGRYRIPLIADEIESFLGEKLRAAAVLAISRGARLVSQL
jgi:hypothetical protein